TFLNGRLPHASGSLRGICVQCGSDFGGPSMTATKSIRCTTIFVTGILLLTLCAGTAVAQASYETVLKNLHFRAVGPAVMGGRVDDIAAVESDPRIFYVGAAAGGLLKTVNGGMTWVSLFDNESN